VVAAIGIITERAPYALTRGATLRGVRIGPESFWIVRTEKEVGLGKWLFENIRTIAPPSTVKTEQRERNRHARRGREQYERRDIKKDRGVFMSASDLQEAQDKVDLVRCGGVWRLAVRPDLKRHPFLGESRLTLIREPSFIAELKAKWANNSKSEAKDPPSSD